MTRLLLIRHATTDTAGRKLAGRMAGIGLNKEGELEAAALAGRLASVTLQAVYSSPLERARQTAGPIAGTHGLRTLILQDLVELDFGDWTGKDIETLKADPDFQRFNTFRSATRIPGGEWMVAAQARMVTCLQAICDKHPGQTVAVIGHSDLLKAAIAHYAGIPLDLLQRIEIDPASVSILEVFAETVRIKLLNGKGAW